MIDGRNFFDELAKTDRRKYENISKLTICHRDYYTTSSLLDYPYFRENCKLIAMNLNNQKGLHADPKASQQINFTGNLERDGNKTTFSFLKS